MTVEGQLRSLAASVSAEQRPVTAAEAVSRATERSVFDGGSDRRSWALVAATIALVVGGVVGLLVWDRAPDDDPQPVVSIPETVAPDTTVPATTVPGDEIRVSGDLVEFGQGLVAGDMTQADGRTYVIAGRYESEDDLLFNPEDAVLAAFDDAGTELWRTEIDGSPSNTTTGRRVVAVGGDVWVWQANGGLFRVDASDGRIVGQVEVLNAESMISAFDSLWVLTRIIDTDGSEAEHPVQLVRVDPDLSTTTVQLAPDALFAPAEGPLVVAAGAGAIWVPMGTDGVAVTDPDTLEVTVISRDEIGHDVHRVAVDSDVVYVASNNQVTSIVDGDIRATASIGEAGEIGLGYLGHVDGLFGAMHGVSPDRLTVLQATDPMVVEDRRASDSLGGAREINGEAWATIGQNNRYNLRRVDLLAVPATTSPPETTATQPSTSPSPSGWSGPLRDTGAAVSPMIVSPDGLSSTWLDPLDASVDWVDVERVVTSLAYLIEDAPADWRIELAAKPPLPAEREPGLIIAYGLVLETTGDEVADYLVGIDNDAPKLGDYHVWVTDLATGETDEQIGPPYGLPIEFAHPDEQPPLGSPPPTPGPATVFFTFLDGFTPPDLDPATVRFYVWTSATRGGEVVAWDYAPDMGWITS